MNYAVFKASGKQYRAQEGDIIEIDGHVSKDSAITFDEVLMHVVDGKVAIGNPTVPSVTVVGKILEHIKGDKIKVIKYKSKVRYRRVTGFRASLTKVLVEKIDTGKSEAKKAQVQTESASAPKKV